MVCPFRVGVKYEYNYIGPDTVEGRQDTNNYIEVAQHALFECCDEDECPFWDYSGGCTRIGDD